MTENEENRQREGVSQTMERNSFFPVGKEAGRFKTTPEMHFFRLIISAKVCVHSKEKPDTVYSTLECFLYPSQGNPIYLRAPLPVKRALCAASSLLCSKLSLKEATRKTTWRTTETMVLPTESLTQYQGSTSAIRKATQNPQPLSPYQVFTCMQGALKKSSRQQ